MNAFLCDDHRKRPCSIRISSACVSESGRFYCDVSCSALMQGDERVFDESRDRAIVRAFKFLRLITIGLRLEDEQGNAVII